MQPVDAVAKYIVVCAHDQYEQTVRLFCNYDAALEEYTKWQSNGCEVYFGNLVDVKPQADTKKLENWKRCCTAANHLADLVCSMYHPNDTKARTTWPTATWAETIASELNIEVPETI